MLPPLNSNAIDQDFEFFNSITTQYNDGTTDRNIDVLTNPTNSISVKPLPPIGTSAIHELKTIPPNAAQANADLYIEFSFDYTIPSGTVITISPPAAVAFSIVSGTNNKD
mmetsp:Transcript_15437/g.2579  ORF Transcript_15437/g.2579 Transcript_15437/m.2579 type:complete len:110 (+) Transcript_15437:3039-3368(+)